MDQNGDNMLPEIPFSFQELLYGDDWHLWDTFPTVDNTNSSPDPTVDMNNNGLAVESGPLVITLEGMIDQFLLLSTNDEQSETASQGENLVVSSQEDSFTFEELLYLVQQLGEGVDIDQLIVDAIVEEQRGEDVQVYTESMVDENLRRRNYENDSDDSENCVICLENLKYGEEASKLPCGHDFHFECIKKWILVKNMCPLCKEKVI